MEMQAVQQKDNLSCTNYSRDAADAAIFAVSVGIVYSSQIYSLVGSLPICSVLMRALVSGEAFLVILNLLARLILVQLYMHKY